MQSLCTRAWIACPSPGETKVCQCIVLWMAQKERQQEIETDRELLCQCHSYNYQCKLVVITAGEIRFSPVISAQICRTLSGTRLLENQNKYGCLVFTKVIKIRFFWGGGCCSVPFSVFLFSGSHDVPFYQHNINQSKHFQKCKSSNRNHLRKIH